MRTPLFAHLLEHVKTGLPQFADYFDVHKDHTVDVWVVKELYDCMAPHVRIRDLLEKPQLHSLFYIQS